MLEARYVLFSILADLYARGDLGGRLAHTDSSKRTNEAVWG